MNTIKEWAVHGVLWFLRVNICKSLGFLDAWNLGKGSLTKNILATPQKEYYLEKFPSNFPQKLHPLQMFSTKTSRKPLVYIIALLKLLCQNTYGWFHSDLVAGTIGTS